MCIEFKIYACTAVENCLFFRKDGSQGVPNGSAVECRRNHETRKAESTIIP